MNHRLVTQYSSIEEQNNNKFLNNQIEINNNWGKPIWGVILQIDLSEKIKDVICKYQEELNQLEPNNLLLLPRPYQHISFNQVIFWGGQYTLGPEKTWGNVANEFVSKFIKLNNSFSSLDLFFNKLIPTINGIIFVASDKNDEMEMLRNEFFKKLPFPKETTKSNHIIHTTVARYKSKLNSPQNVVNYLQSKMDTVLMKVERISLKKELIFPSIKTEEIACIDLL